MKYRAAALQALDKIEAGARAADLEGDNLDFKQEGRGVEETMQTIAFAAICLANSQGGTIVVGVEDKTAGPAGVSGTSIDPADLRLRIHQLSRPGLVVEIERHERAGKDLLLVHVPEGIDVHSDPKGRAPRRIKDECQPMTPTEQARLVDERRRFDWSAEPSERKISEASPLALAAARDLLKKAPDATRRSYARLDDRDLLSTLGLVGAGGELLTAGELLFCANGRLAIVYQYRQTPGGEPRSIERLETPLVLALVRCLELVQARRNLTPVTLPAGQQLPIEDYPELAVREALVNGAIHRDWRESAPVVVEHSPDVLVVTSPGPLVLGVTPQNIITHPSKPRNPALTKAVRLLGFAEEVGRGVDRMVRETIRAGRRTLPHIEGTFDSVRVTLTGGAPDSRVARFVAQLPEEEREDTDTLLVLFSLLGRASVDASGLAPLLQQSEEEAEAVLRRLASDDAAIIEPTRGTARRSRPRYRFRGEALRALGPALPYQRRTADEIDRKIVAHVQEYGKITNRTIQNLFDFEVMKARDVLADLVARRILVKTSGHQRGPGVEYGPGEKFPAARRSRQ